MYVCLCEGVSDKDIRKAVEAGACSAAEVMRCTRAGTRCGSCRSEVAEIVAGAQGPRRRLDVVETYGTPAARAA